MKRIVGYLASWALFWLGDITAKLMNHDPLAWLYPVYNRIMGWSVDVQDWSGVDGPWKEAKQ